MSENTEKKLRITLVRSVISSKQKHRKTVQALGLRKIRQTVEHRDNEAIRGMIARVGHLIEVEEVE